MPTIRILPPGSASNFSRNSHGRAFALNGDNGAAFPIVLRPIEIISGSAVPKSCTAPINIDQMINSFVIPQGTLGVNSVLQIEPLWSFTNSANNKILKIKINESTVYNVTRTASIKEAPLIVLANRNSLTSQIKPLDGSYVTDSSVAIATYSIDFSADAFVQFIGNRANIADAITLEYYRVLHFIGE